MLLPMEFFHYCGWYHRGLAKVVQVLAMADGGLVLSLSLHSFYNNSFVTVVLLVILSLPLLISATKKIFEATIRSTCPQLPVLWGALGLANGELIDNLVSGAE